MKIYPMGSRVVPRTSGLTDGRDEANSRFS